MCFKKRSKMLCLKAENLQIQSALVIRTTFVPLCFFEKNVLIFSGSYECSYSQRNYIVFWNFVLTLHVLITRFLYDVLISRVLITRVDCTVKPLYSHTVLSHSKFWKNSDYREVVTIERVNSLCLLSKLTLRECDYKEAFHMMWL